MKHSQFWARLVPGGSAFCRASQLCCTRLMVHSRGISGCVLQKTSTVSPLQQRQEFLVTIDQRFTDGTRCPKDIIAKMSLAMPMQEATLHVPDNATCQVRSQPDHVRRASAEVSLVFCQPGPGLDTSKYQTSAPTCITDNARRFADKDTCSMPTRLRQKSGC
jgi:hypothetical protein